MIAASEIVVKSARSLQPGEITWTWCSRHCERTKHLWTGHRLICLECHPEYERLQGFPDGWTEGQSDSARYRMLGNAVAVPCAEWIARRIVKLEEQNGHTVSRNSLCEENS